MQDNVTPPQTVTSSPFPDNHDRRNFLLPTIGAVALVAFTWFAWDTRNAMNEMRQDLSVRLAQVDDRNKETLAAAAQARQDTKEALAKVSVLENKLAESQNQQVALEALYQELSKNRDEVSLAEIEDVLDLASQQLQLAGNVKSALIALQSVDTKLARADGKSRWTQLRRAINQDMERLKATPFVDTIAISAKLDNLMASIDSLPLLSDPVITEETEPTSPSSTQRSFWARFGREVLSDLGELVRVRNLGKPDVPLLAPSQSYFLRENLKLRLLNARLALLARAESSFKADLNGAAQWLADYFDPKIKAVTTAQATLKQLAENPISISVPDITDSLNAIRAARHSREKANR
jgi:uroporphyrin-3 C-methyltransferase